MVDLLAIFPHPDDETWIAGATLARAVRAGLRVRVLVLTRGERGWDRTGRWSTPEQMACAREREFHAACDALGVSDRTIEDLPDLRLSGSSLSRVLARELDRSRPRWLISFASDGGYGHVDHIASFEAIRALLAEREAIRSGATGAEGGETKTRRISRASTVPAADATDSPRPTWVTTIARDGRCARVWNALRKLKTADPIVVADFPERRKRAIARPSHRLPVDDLRDVKLAALRAHDSQLRDGEPRSFLHPALIETLLIEETLSFESGEPAAFGELFVRLTKRAP